MKRLAILIAAGAAALALTASGSAMSAAKLNGSVGPGFTISLKKGSAKAKTLKRGKYTIVINDRSSIHNFHLKGPGVNKKTGVGFVGKKTWTVTLKKGTYKFVCDPHASTMRGSFKVT